MGGEIVVVKFAEISPQSLVSKHVFVLFEFGAAQKLDSQMEKRANLAQLEKCCKMNNYTQKSASTQPRTSPPIFGNVVVILANVWLLKFIIHFESTFCHFENAPILLPLQ